MKPRKLATEQQSKIETQAKILATIIFALLASAFLVSTSNADSSIDPLTQTYFVTENDHVGPMKLKRLYSSTTVFRGAFGAGWCSELDARILLYSGGENRYRACDLESAQLIERRASDIGVQITANGFRYRRNDGTTLHFSKRGLLERIARDDGELKIHRGVDMAISEVIAQTSRGEIRNAVQMDLATGLVHSIGVANHFDYRDGLLMKTNQARYDYDDLLNMTSRMSDAVSEAIVYDEREDRVIQIVRSSAFGRDRLLLAIARTGKLNGIEMKIEVDRGAEMRPVRILYNRLTRRLSLEGDRDIARLLLNWIRA